MKDMEMITRQTVAQKLIDYMNGTLTLAVLVDWAETALIDTPVEDALTHDVLAYIGVADVDGFPLGWGECHEFLTRLGAAVRVEMVAA
jgi:hypothetical protein